MLAKHETILNVVIENDWSAACRAKGFIPDFQTWTECELPAYPTLELIGTLLEKTKTRVNDLCCQDRKRNLERWSHELHTSWKSQGNSLAHKQSKPQSNPFLNKAEVQETIRARRTRIVTKGPPMCQIEKQERHHLHHLALPKDMRWHNQQKGIFVAPGHVDPTIEVQCHRWHLQTTDVQQAFFNFWAKSGKVTRRQVESLWTSHLRASGESSRPAFSRWKECSRPLRRQMCTQPSAQMVGDCRKCRFSDQPRSRASPRSLTIAYRVCKNGHMHFSGHELCSPGKWLIRARSGMVDR